MARNGRRTRRTRNILTTLIVSLLQHTDTQTDRQTDRQIGSQFDVISLRMLYTTDKVNKASPNYINEQIRILIKRHNAVTSYA